MERNRAWRRHQLFKNWHRRLKNELHWWPYTFKGKTWRDLEEWRDNEESNYSTIFCLLKTTGKPCSCYSCRGPHYKRLYYKFESDRLIREELYDDITHQTPRSHNKKLIDWD